MEVTVREEANWQRVVAIVATQEDLRQNFENAYKKFQKKAKLEGFRKGKVPIPIIKKLYGDKIQSGAVEEILPVIFALAREQKDLKTVTPAKIQKLEFIPGKELKVEFLVEIEPEFELKKIEGFKFERTVYEVSDADIDDAVENVRRQNAAWQTSDDPIDESDFVKVDMQEIDVGGLPIIGKRHENQLVQVVADNGEMTQVGRQLLGAKINDKRVVSITSDQPQNSDAPVEPLKFEVTIKEVNKRILPDVDDELAKDTGRFETLDEMKAELAHHVQAESQKQFDEILQHLVIDEILKNNPVDPPNGMVDSYIDAYIENLKKSSGEGNGSFDEEMVRKEYKPRVIWNIKWQLVRSKIQRENDITVVDDEIEAWVRQTAGESNVDARRTWNRLKNDTEQIDIIRKNLLEKKTMDFLFAKQKIKESKVNRTMLEKRRALLGA